MVRPMMFAIAAMGLALAPAFAQSSSARAIKRDTVVKRAAGQFDRLDLNKDGVVDAAEKNAAIEEAVAKVRARMQARFDEADSDKDGKISRDEYVGARGAWFDGVDANADGIIDAAELRAYTNQRGRNAREGAKP